MGLALRRHLDENNDVNLFLVSLIGPLLIYFLFPQLACKGAGKLGCSRLPGACGSRRTSCISTTRAFSPHAGRNCAVATIWPSRSVFIRSDRLPASSRRPHPARSRKRPHSFDGRMGPFRRQVDAVAEDMGAKYILTSHYVLTSEFKAFTPVATQTDHSIQRAHTLALVRNASALFLTGAVFTSPRLTAIPQRSLHRASRNLERSLK